MKFKIEDDPLANQPKPSVPGRNDLCPCGSRKKYKKCCALLQPQVKAGPPAGAVSLPRDPSAIWRSAVHAFEHNDLEKAETECDRLLKLDPADAESLHLRGLIAYRRGDHPESLKYAERAVRQAPRNALFHNTLGIITQALGRLEAAESAYRTALRLDPACSPASINLGDLLETRGQVLEAERYYRSAVEHDPQSPEALNNLGKVLNRLGRPEESVHHLATAVKLHPGLGKAQYNLSCALRALGRKDEALASLTQALKASPEIALAWHDLGLHFKERGVLAEARAAFERAVQLDPKLVEGYLNLGNVFHELGLGDRARACFERASTIKESDALKVRMALSLPGVYQSTQEMAETRDRFAAEIDRLMAEGLRIADPNEEVSLTPFYLAYQGRNDVALLSRVADLFLKACPALGFISPHCVQPGPGFDLSSKQVEIGFISSFLGRQHIVNRVMTEFIAQWPRERFHVTVLHLDWPGAEVKDALREGDRVVKLPFDLTAARERIAAEKLDILFYTDLGLEPWTYFLSFARLAPIQCTSGGHPVTSGVPAIDYYISSTVDETPSAQEHYREKVVLLSERPVCYYPAAVPQLNKGRADFGLADDRRVYLCPMTPFKLQPEMDEIFREILKADEAGEIVFVLNRQPELWQSVQARFARTIPDVLSRLRYLPFLPLPEFIELLRLADVMLDTLSFGGGTTSLEALAIGTPVVTLPGELLRQRATSGLYQRMGVLDCVAHNVEDYVRRAVEIARHPERRAAIKQEILARNHVLFGQQAGLREAGEFLLDALQSRYLPGSD